ncbi:alpha-glucosidase C-terminal domain-containing protein [Flavobacteriaceae bacterium]|nr:alpha-glucosidase C-terminal domain-containing protein [Flavobacteriaceae bacterium]
MKFFEKDSIPKTKGNMWSLLKKLGTLKNNYTALNGGKNAASYTRLQTENENVLAFKRGQEKDVVYFVGNLSSKTQTFSVNIEGTYFDLIQQKNSDINKKEMQLEPWNYYLITPHK